MPTSLTEVLWTARYDYQPDWKLAKHKHEHFQMLYVVSGAANFFLGGQDYKIETGALVLVKPRQIHGLDPISTVRTLDIKFVVKDRRLRNVLCKSPEAVVNSIEGVTDLFERIRQEGERKRLHYRELCSAFLVELLLLFLRAVDEREQEGDTESSIRALPLGDGILQQAAQFIRDHHAEDFSLIEVAKAVGRSDRHIRQHFKEGLGISPHRYLLEYRIQRSQQLIEFSNYSFKEIAAMVGFKTVHHFTRAFHDTCGETPGGWRRKYQAGICKDVNIDPEFVNTNWTIRLDVSPHEDTLN